MNLYIKYCFYVNVYSNSSKLLPHNETNFLTFPTVYYSHYLGPTGGGVVSLKTGKREVPGSNPVRTCRPSCSDFSAVFSETRVNTVSDPLERPPLHGEHSIYKLRSHKRTICLKPKTQLLTFRQTYCYISNYILNNNDIFFFS